MRVFIVLALLGASLAATAQELDEGPIDQGMLEEERLHDLEQASGIVVDRTITQFGAEFARVFAQTWRALPGSAEFEVTIIERPTARYGSLVWIENNNRPIARAFLYAGRSAAIRPIAVAAADYVANKLADDALASQLFEDPDLARGGF